MKKRYKLIGFLCIIIAVISMLLLLAKGFNYLEIENTYTFAILVFVSVLLPSIGVPLIKKK